MKIVQEHLVPKPLCIAEKFIFHNRSQLEGESITFFNETVADIVKTLGF